MLYLTSTKIISLHGQAVKTSPSHGGIWGSIPHGGAKNNRYQTGYLLFFCTPWGKAHPVGFSQWGAQVALATWRKQNAKHFEFLTRFTYLCDIMFIYFNH